MLPEPMKQHDRYQPSHHRTKQKPHYQNQSYSMLVIPTSTAAGVDVGDGKELNLGPGEKKKTYLEIVYIEKSSRSR